MGYIILRQEVSFNFQSWHLIPAATWILALMRAGERFRAFKFKGSTLVMSEGSTLPSIIYPPARCRAQDLSTPAMPARPSLPAHYRGPNNCQHHFEVYRRYLIRYGWLSKLWSPCGSPKYYRCCIILKTQKGTIILTTTHIALGTEDHHLGNYRGLTVHPRGSKYPIFEVHGSKDHTANGIWDQSP